MAGDRYGWIPLPYVIEQNEYETILQIIDDLLDKELLNREKKIKGKEQCCDDVIVYKKLLKDISSRIGEIAN